MYGFGGSGSVGADSKEGDRSLSGTSSAASAAGKAASAASAAANAASNASRAASSAASAASRASSSSNAGREGTTSGPGNPSAGGGTASKGGRVGGGGGSVGADSKEGDRSLSAGVDPNRFGGRSINASSTPTGMRAGDVGAVSRENDRSLSVGVDPSRFGGPATGFNTSTPTGMRVGGNGVVGADAREGDRSLSTGIDPTRFGSTRGFGYATAFGDDREIDRSLSTPSFQSFRSTDLAEMRRAQEDKSMDTYRADAAAALSADNARRADSAIAMRAAEATSMEDLGYLKESYRHAIAGIESVGKKDPYSALGGWIAAKQDRAYGKYQVMGKNIPSWTKQALGYSMTPKEFLADPKAQDATFDAIFGGYVAKYGLEKAAQAWYGGPNSIGKLGRTDPHGKINVGQYGAKVARDSAKTYEALKAGRTMAPALDGTTNVPDKASFADKYLGGSQANQPGPEFGRVGTITGVSPEESYFGSTPQKGGYAAANETALKAQEAVRTGQPEEGDAGAPAGAPAVAAPKERSIAGSLIGGGVDVLTSLNPLTAGVNLLTQLVTGKSLGDHIADGDNQYDGTIKGDSGSRGDRHVPPPAKITKPGSTVKTATFADKYLDDTGFSDPVKRPTPAQKWGEGSLPAEYGKSEYA